MNKHIADDHGQNIISGENRAENIVDWAWDAAHATASLQAEIEKLRREVAEWKRVAAAQAELHLEAEERAERLAQAARSWMEQALNMLDEANAARAVLRGMPEYTVRRCRSLSNDDRIGPTHGSDDGEYTICGIEINQYWWTETTGGSGTVTCKKCLSRQNAYAMAAATSPEGQAEANYVYTVPDECETLHWRGQILSMNELAALAKATEQNAL